MVELGPLRASQGDPPCLGDHEDDPGGRSLKMLNRIGQIAVVASDVKRATTFYRDVLGMKLLFEVPPKLSFFDCGGVRLMISLPEGEGVGKSSILYYKVDDIQAVHRTLSDRGVAFMTSPHMVAKLPDHELWLADFRDSEGNVLALMSEVR